MTLRVSETLTVEAKRSLVQRRWMLRPWGVGEETTEFFLLRNRWRRGKRVFGPPPDYSKARCKALVTIFQHTEPKRRGWVRHTTSYPQHLCRVPTTTTFIYCDLLFASPPLFLDNRELNVFIFILSRNPMCVLDAFFLHPKCAWMNFEDLPHLPSISYSVAESQILFMPSNFSCAICPEIPDISLPRACCGSA